MTQTKEQNAVEFTMAVELDDLINCGGIEGLNDIADETAKEKYPRHILSDISYKTAGFKTPDTFFIKVSAVLQEVD